MVNTDPITSNNLVGNCRCLKDVTVHSFLEPNILRHVCAPSLGKLTRPPCNRSATYYQNGVSLCSLRTTPIGCGHAEAECMAQTNNANSDGDIS